MRPKLPILMLTIFAVLAGCKPSSEPVVVETVPAKPRPPILLVTLDTTRGDRVGYANESIRTPHLDALAAEGRVYTRAYATAPMTLPSHVSIFTGLYPGQHGIRENARTLSPELHLLAESLRSNGYQTAAIVSSAVLDSGFGLSRGFDSYSDDVDAETQERSAEETTRQALEFLSAAAMDQAFLWVHYYDPHHPYRPPADFAAQYPDQPYSGEIAYMDDQLGKLLAAFRERYKDGEFRIVVVGDHGESLDEHGEPYHGHLLYEGVMRVPLVVAGAGIEATTIDEPVSIRRIYDTIMDWVGLEAEASLMQHKEEVVLAEAMKPYLHYGWSPQVMAVKGSRKVIRAASLEVYDLDVDESETKNLADSTRPAAEIMRALVTYPVPGLDTPVESDLSDEQLERLASLGYAASPGLATKTGPRPDPKQMTGLFPALDLGSDLFISERYAEAVPVFERILEKDPGNLMVCLRLAMSYSLLGQADHALEKFERCAEISPSSLDVRHQLGMHLFRNNQILLAAEQYEWVLERDANKAQALEYLAEIRRRQKRIFESIDLFKRAAELKQDPDIYLGLARMYQNRREPHGAAEAYESARDILGDDFRNHLDLGICYVGLARLEEAAFCFDQVPFDHPGFAQAMFRRAKLAVLLNEPDVAERIQNARENSNAQTKVLIDREVLFKKYQ